MRLLLILFVSGLILSCEQSVEVKLPYKEQLVIKGEIKANQQTNFIFVSKTMPPLTSYEDMYKEHLIKDAEVILKVNDKEYVCNYIGESNYQTNEYLPVINDVVHLTVKWKDLTAFATTVIPNPVEPEKFRYNLTKDSYNKERLRIYAYIKPQDGFVYLGGWIDTASNWIFDYTYNMIRSKPLNKEGYAVLTVYDESNWYDITWNELLKKYQITIDVFDEKYFDYYTNFLNDYDDGFFYGSAGQNIDWNVKGDGFGIFAGRTRTYHKVDIDIK